MIDDIIACEFDAADLEFSWTPTETIDPVAQEQIRSSYTSRGILTLNEARAMLGRDPLPESAADTPMALTGTGYVGLGGTMPSTHPVGKAEPGTRADIHGCLRKRATTKAVGLPRPTLTSQRRIDSMHSIRNPALTTMSNARTRLE